MTVLRLHGDDYVAVTTEPIAAGTSVNVSGIGLIHVVDPIPAGHKFATRRLERGATVHKYGSIIGVATQPIPTGAHVHTHNLASQRARGGGAPE